MIPPVVYVVNINVRRPNVRRWPPKPRDIVPNTINPKLCPTPKKVTILCPTLPTKKIDLITWAS